MRRTAIAVVVPVLAVAAHGVASGTAPTPIALALSGLVGVLVGQCAPAPNRLIGLFAALALGQALAHIALSVGGAAGDGSTHPMDMAHMGRHVMDTGAQSGTRGFAMMRDHLLTVAHPFSADGSLMLLTHVLVIPVCVALIALAGTVAAAATAVVAVLRWRRRLAPPDAVAVIPAEVHGRRYRLDRAGGLGVRGPPLALV